MQKIEIGNESEEDIIKFTIDYDKANIELLGNFKSFVN